MGPQKALWVRSFTREEGNDDDLKADASILKLLSSDFFGWFLQQGANLDINTLNGLASIFWNGSKAVPADYTMATYCVADGAFIKQPIAFTMWFDPHIRFLISIQPSSTQWSSTQLFVVGSNQVNSSLRFLQVASWDTKVFHFYGIEAINGDNNNRAWTYQGNSAEAFGDNEYLGPFNGHVNGACIMKELHNPWYHWYSGENSNVSQCFSDDDMDTFKSTPWLTGSGQSVFTGASVRFANELEPSIQSTVTNWYSTRLTNDLVESSTLNNRTPKKQPSNIPRWMAHILLTTTINISTSTNDGMTYTAPLDHFVNNELLSSYGDLLPGGNSFTFDIEIYNNARDALGLSLLQEVDPDDVSKLPPEIPTVTLKPGTLGGGKQTDEHDWTVFIVSAPNTEGVPFVILQSSYEDSQGVQSIQQIGLGDGFPQALLSDKAFQALTMIDFCNPVYSWRRGVLFQYVPSSTSLQGAEYDFEANFVSAIKQSTFAQDPSSPEYQFLAFYTSSNQASDYQNIIQHYFDALMNQFNTIEGMIQHLKLAEARRRLYRPLPLDEFGFTLPYATKIPVDAPFLEMTPAGEIQPIPTRGLEFLLSWTATLWTFDPKLLPQFKGLSPSAEGIASMHKAFLHTKSTQGSGCPAMHTQNSRCPATSTRSYGRRRPKISGVESSPTWNDQIAALFSNPYWVANGKVVGSSWREAMLSWSPPTPEYLQLDLADPMSVQYNAVTIYQHLRSKAMPVTSNPSELWPEDALETFRLWANQGFRRTSTDPISSKVIIPPPNDPPATLRVRKDILSLSASELQAYRVKLDDVLQVGKLGSTWQELGLLHAEWCLHYQEATFFWHRAFLRHVEELIDYPIPYWNGFAKDTSDPNSPYAGIPSIFLDQTYLHPDGHTRPNPLRYALSLNGKNKLGTNEYVERAEVLLDGPQNPNWPAKIGLFDLYHQQIQLALTQPSYSVTQAIMPWANLPAFSDKQPDSDYPDWAKVTFFDGHFEQAHDNYHGWVGPDMADNSYTAFDPIFLSYHANIDRIVEMYLRARPTQALTANTPLQPFIHSGRDLAYSDPRPYLYASTGDMAKDTKALQYLYAPPFSPDYFPLSKDWSGVKPTGGTSLATATEKDAPNANWAKASPAELKTAYGATGKISPRPYVVFPNVSCTKDSFQIDVFVKGAASHAADQNLNPDFIGRMTRLGMGPRQNKNGERCDKPAITRMLDAGCVIERLTKNREIEQVVTDISSGKLVEGEEWKGWEGFVGKLVWSSS